MAINPFSNQGNRGQVFRTATQPVRDVVGLQSGALAARSLLAARMLPLVEVTY